MRAWGDLTELARAQYGLVSRQQALRLQVPIAALDKRAAREAWERPQPGVLALPGSLDSDERRLMAAILAVQGDGWVTRWSAAYLWGLVGPLRSPVSLIVPHEHRAAALHRVKVTRSRTLEPEQLTSLRGIPVVTVERMLADLARVADLPELRGVAIDARQKGLLDPSLLWPLWERFGPGRGRPVLFRLASELNAEGQVDSVFEAGMRGLVRRSGLPPPFPGPCPVMDAGQLVARVDIAWPLWKVGIECDGYRYHSKREQLDRDSARQNRLMALGWRLVRVTWAQFRTEPEVIIAVVRALLREAGAFADDRVQ
jgi:hypothetical protein